MLPPVLNPSPIAAPRIIRMNPRTKSVMLRCALGFLFSRATRMNPGMPIRRAPLKAARKPAEPAALYLKMFAYFPI